MLGAQGASLRATWTQHLEQKGPESDIWWEEPFTALALRLLEDLRDVDTAQRLTFKEDRRCGHTLAIDRELTS